MSTKMVIVNKNEEIVTLTQDEAKLVFNQVINKIKQIGDISSQPNGIEGLRILVELHKELETELITFIESFPVKNVGAWICSGWEKSISMDAGKRRFYDYLSRLEKEGNSFTKKAAQIVISSKI